MECSWSSWNWRDKIMFWWFTWKFNPWPWNWLTFILSINWVS